jgi:hypothetical protein
MESVMLSGPDIDIVLIPSGAVLVTLYAKSFESEIAGMARGESNRIPSGEV